jgi:hypothetical protein
LARCSHRLSASIPSRSSTHATWVSRQIPVSRRREILSWSHHFEVAGLPAHDQDAFLEAAIDNGWSTRDLREAVRASKGVNGKAGKIYNIIKPEVTQAELGESAAHCSASECIKSEVDSVSVKGLTIKNKVDAVVPTMEEILIELREVHKMLPEKAKDNHKFKDLGACILSLHSTVFYLSRIDPVCCWAERHGDADVEGSRLNGVCVDADNGITDRSEKVELALQIFGRRIPAISTGEIQEVDVGYLDKPVYTEKPLEPTNRGFRARSREGGEGARNKPKHICTTCGKLIFSILSWPSDCEDGACRFKVLKERRTID